MQATTSNPADSGATTTTPAGSAGKQPIKYTADHPEFPKLMYNSKTRTTAPANDKDAETKLQGEGYSEDPYPVLPPDQMTPQDMQQLESLLHKLLKELAKYSTPQTTSAGAGAAGSAGSAGTAAGGTTSQAPVPGAVAYAGATGATGATGSQTGAAGSQAATGAHDWTKPAPPPKK